MPGGNPGEILVVTITLVLVFQVLVIDKPYKSDY
jgi:hypothetical protein